MPQHQLYGLRGKAYAAKYKQLYEQLKDTLEQEVNNIKTETGKFTLFDFGALCMKYQLPASVMDRFLTNILPNWGYEWEMRRDRGVKAKDIGIIWNDDNSNEEIN